MVTNIPSESIFRAMGGEHKYKETIQIASKFNIKLLGERRLRQPFLDAQTRVAQVNSRLWFRPHERLPAVRKGQICTYPQVPWRKKRRSSYLLPVRPVPGSEVPGSDVHTAQSIDGSSAFGSELRDSHSRDDWYKDIDDISEINDAIAYQDYQDSDFDDYDDGYKKKRSSSRKSGSTKRPKLTKSDSGAADDKPFMCEICGARYKTRSGIVYHEKHAHQDDTFEEEEFEELVPERKPSSRRRAPEPEPENAGKPKKLHCDFCSGDDKENKKTGLPEELILCSDCTRAGHPTCLNFTPNMLISVKKYRWQCIECKTCSLCGTADNDDQLLFCDDCDRGYHMYCLQPPLTEPPEGDWRCHLCIVEFGPMLPGQQSRGEGQQRN